VNETRGIARGFIPAALMLVVFLVACRQPALKCPPKAAADVASASPALSATSSGSATPPEQSPYGEIWIGNRINVDGIATFDPQVVREFFDVPSSYVIEGWDVWPWASHAQRTAYWASEAEFEQDRSFRVSNRFGKGPFYTRAIIRVHQGKRAVPGQVFGVVTQDALE
jgi:hypothetical protein